LQESYFDWNEVRVTTVRELGEVFRKIPNSTANALNLKNTLQSIFEGHFTFDIDHFKKQNLGKTVSMLESYKGTTPFTIAFATQRNLGGHAIPLSKGAIDIMYIVGAISEKEAAAASVPGLERAIPKTKGVEFGSLLHQLAAELTASPFSTKVRNILLEIDPDCKDRLPKRADKKKAEAEKKKRIQEEREKKEAAAKKKADAERKAAEKAANKSAAKKKAEAAKREAEREKAKAAKEAEAQKKAAAAAKKKKAVKKAAPKKAAKATKKAAPAKKKAAKKKTATKAAPKKAAKKKTAKKKKLVKKASKKTSKKSASKQLARRKPR
jgi:DNA polymerase III gamma/tau subunit